jgi:hypothetical protein
MRQSHSFTLLLDRNRPFPYRCSHPSTASTSLPLQRRPNRISRQEVPVLVDQVKTLKPLAHSFTYCNGLMTRFRSVPRRRDLRHSTGRDQWQQEPPSGSTSVCAEASTGATKPPSGPNWIQALPPRWRSGTAHSDFNTISSAGSYARSPKPTLNG